MTGRQLSLDDLRNEIVAELVMLRHDTGERSQEEQFVKDVITFAKTWGLADSAFIRRPPQMQMMHVTINGQPFDPSQMGDTQWNTTQSKT